MNESKYTYSVNKKLPPEIDWWKIADRYKAGVADCLYSGPDNKNLWIEYKHDEKAPKTINLQKRITPLQDKWLTWRHQNGHNVAVIYATDQEGAIILRFPEWRKNITHNDFVRRCIPRKDLIAWILGEIL